MTFDAFLKKYKTVLTDEMKEDLLQLVAFLQEEARQSFERSLDQRSL